MQIRWDPSHCLVIWFRIRSNLGREQLAAGLVSTLSNKRYPADIGTCPQKLNWGMKMAGPQQGSGTGSIPAIHLAGATGPLEPPPTLPWHHTWALHCWGRVRCGTVALARTSWGSITAALITQILLKSLFHQTQCLNLELGSFISSSRLQQRDYSVLSNCIKSQNNC